VVDPRTGEIIKGHVTLGSLRVRQDYLIAEGLLAPYEKGTPVSTKMQEMALARLRQLSAHEVGHTLGLEHNYSSSTVNRSSVMDYPPPVAKLAADQTIELSDAYATGIGEWDKVSIAFGYQAFAAGTDEHAALNKILMDGYGKGLRYLTDQDARPAGSSSSLAHLWDSGSNGVEELNRLMQVRAVALKKFGENNIREICGRDGLHLRPARRWRSADKNCGACGAAARAGGGAGYAETVGAGFAGAAATDDSAAATGLPARPRTL
jgi:hypothetical protein